MLEAIRLSKLGSDQNHGGPFGAVIVKNDIIIGRGYNQVIGTNDPTAHAEMVAIRDACANTRQYHLEGTIIYTSCEPCPMCLAAIYWARIDVIFMANTKSDAAEIGFDDQFFYEEISKDSHQRSIKSTVLLRKEGKEVFTNWAKRQDVKLY